MTCIEKIYSVSALVGGSACNGNCSFCAAKNLRKTADNRTDIIKANFDKNLEAAIKLCARYGGWSLSLTSSGEPTCSPWEVVHALEIYTKCANQGAYFPNVNLFSNGILFGDKGFCDVWLPTWKKHGLTNIAISVHSTNTERQAQFYGISKYPNFENIFENIKNHGIGVRCTLLLNQLAINNSLKYEIAVNDLIDMGCDNITSWPVGNPDGSRNKYTPSRWNLWGIHRWLNSNAKLCHGHAWGGGVYDYNGNILRITDYVTRHDPKKDFVRQLVVFQDGTVTYSWIKEGALCLK
jgi:sulfatase maturation enzyme AslB (radical SAM superfamily)